MDFGAASAEGPGRTRRAVNRASISYRKPSLRDHGKNAGSNRDSEDHSDLVSDGNEGQVFRQWKKGDPCWREPGCGRWKL